MDVISVHSAQPSGLLDLWPELGEGSVNDGPIGSELGCLLDRFKVWIDSLLNMYYIFNFNRQPVQFCLYLTWDPVINKHVVRTLLIMKFLILLKGFKL